MAYRSLDTDFITLRNVTAYNPDNSFVEPNLILTTSTNGTTTWSNQLTISSISASSITTSSLTALSVSTSTLSTNIINMTNGQITGVSSINGQVYPPLDDVFWKQVGTSGNIYFVNTTSSVGIGTSTPSTMLTVGTHEYPLFGDTANASTVITGPGNNPVSSINSIIDGSRDGNYTCGLLVVSNTSSINTGGSIGFGGISPDFDGTVPYGRITGVYEGNDLQGGLAFETLQYPTANAGLVERIRITHEGYVGIGTTTPGANLDISGNIVTQYTDYVSIDFSGCTCRIDKINGNSTIIQNTAGPLLLGGNQTDNQYALLTLNQGTLDVSGNVNILSSLSTNIINMTNGQITGLSSINGQAYPPIDDTFWKQVGSSGNIYFVNTTSSVGIGNSAPSSMLTVGTPNYGLYAVPQMLQTSTIIYGPSVMPVTYDYVNSDPSILSTFNRNCNSVLSVYSNTSTLQNTGGSISMGGTETFSNNIVPFARVSGVAPITASGINGDFSIETLYQTSGSDFSLLERMRITYDGKVGINTSRPNTTLDIQGDATISNLGQTIVYTTPGTTTLVIPSDADYLYFEMIGAGGFPIGSSSGGNGGYIKGKIYVRDFRTKTLDIQVGTVALNPTNSSSASYITFTSTGPIFVIAGAGGNAGSVNGGHGGGGTFDTSGIAYGISGTNGIDGSGGGGGTSIGGLGGIGEGGISNGSNGSNPSGFVDVTGGLGGIGSYYSGGNGGNGYSGGGGGGGGSFSGSSGGGGGGSSYINLSYITVISSYDGSGLPANILSGYGRSNNNGFVSIQFTSGTALTVDNDTVIGGTMNFNNKYYEYQMIATNINGSLCGWPYGTYVDICGNIIGDSAMSLIINGNEWICPESGLWQICLNLKDTITTSDHIVVGNITTNRPICSNKSSSSVFISQGEHILTTGNFNNIGDVNGTISMLLLMPMNMSINVPAQTLLSCP